MTVQFDLFGPAAFRRLKAENAQLQEQLALGSLEYRTLCEERDTLRQERETLTEACTRLAAERDCAERYAALWRQQYERSYAAFLRGAARAAPAPALEPILKQLLRLAHPDRWGRGQLASELAHELALTINRLREEVEGTP
jgi:hypothetical protein